MLLAGARDVGGPVTDPTTGARAETEIADGVVRVRIDAGEPLDEIVLRSYAIGAAHMALSWLSREGISVDEAGKQHYLDVHVAYRQACLNAIEYMKKFGYTGAQAYAILGTAPVEGRISGIVDIPNACATLALPTEIFSFDIKPSATGPIPRAPAGKDLSVAT